MIFLSAQPDDYYFTWQLELQIYNFTNLGISAENIHILVGYDPKRDLWHYFDSLIEQYKNIASFFTYPDLREYKNYAPSLRPHIIAQHLKKFPHLQNESIFYHDSDIIFRELPDFLGMSENDTYYVSDTRSYLDSLYIKKIQKMVFLRRCVQR